MADTKMVKVLVRKGVVVPHPRPDELEVKQVGSRLFVVPQPPLPRVISDGTHEVEVPEYMLQKFPRHFTKADAKAKKEAAADADTKADAKAAGK